jgi:hypothetical protein
VGTTLFHGVTFGVPHGWVDNSVLRFTSPADQSDPIVSQGFTQNVVVTSHEVPSSVPMLNLFEAPNRAARGQTIAFEVLDGGECRYLGQPAVFQDVTFSDPRVKTVLCQRQVAVKAENGLTVILTMTSDRKRFREATSAFPVEQLAPKKR